MLIEHAEGRPGAKVATVADTTINLIARFPWGEQKCPKCGHKLGKVKEEEEAVPEEELVQ